MKKFISFSLAVLMFLLCSCSGEIAREADESDVGTETQNENADIGGFAEFIDNLDKDGIEYILGEGEDTEQFFSVPRQFVLIGEDIISVYEYPSSDEMEADAACVDRGGCSISVPGRFVHISWSSLTHFYKKDRVIVNYVGENERIISHLIEHYGAEFAGSDAVGE